MAIRATRTVVWYRTNESKVSDVVEQSWNDWWEHCESYDAFSFVISNFEEHVSGGRCTLLTTMYLSITSAVLSLSLLVRASNVVELNPANFDSVVGRGKPALVELCVQPLLTLGNFIDIGNYLQLCTLVVSRYQNIVPILFMHGCSAVTVKYVPSPYVYIPSSLRWSSEPCSNIWRTRRCILLF